MGSTVQGTWREGLAAGAYSSLLLSEQARKQRGHRKLQSQAVNLKDFLHLGLPPKGSTASGPVLRYMCLVCVSRCVQVHKHQGRGSTLGVILLCDRSSHVLWHSAAWLG